MSLTYNGELDDLQVVLCKAKGQSNQEIGDLNDIFVNTYLVPDLRFVYNYTEGAVNLQSSSYVAGEA